MLQVEFEKEDQDTVYKSVKVFRWCRDKQEYVPLKVSSAQRRVLELRGRGRVGKRQ